MNVPAREVATTSDLLFSRSLTLATGHRATARRSGSLVSRAGDASEAWAERFASAFHGRAYPIRAPLPFVGRRAARIPGHVRSALATPSRPLAAPIREHAELLGGVNLAAVRVHDDDSVGRSARTLGALAYTVENHIVGKRHALTSPVLAHEVAHVIAPPSAVLARYETPEHRSMGDAKLEELKEFLASSRGGEWARQNKVDPSTVASLSSGVGVGVTFLIGRRRGVRATVGDVVALMGDFYATPAELLNAPEEELLELLGDDRAVSNVQGRRVFESAEPVQGDQAKAGRGRAAMRPGAIERERRGELTGGEASAEYQRITSKYRANRDTFLELGRRNLSHFAPGNLETWKSMHLEALKMVQSPNATAGDFERALFLDAAAGHFLTDAFASGHLFDAPQVEAAIVAYLRDHPPSPDNKELSAYYFLIETQNAMFKLVLKNVHDRLNAEGAEVTNGAGIKWKTFGDDHLKSAPETARIAAFAVYASRMQLYEARSNKERTFDPADVLRYLPDDASRASVTQRAMAHIPEASRGVPELLFRQRVVAREGLKPLFGDVGSAIIKSNLETVADPLRSKQLEEASDRARATGMPQPVSQFTLGRF